ncbi:hypothetical protein [Burkholderia pseudomallei]|uniref:hypothetical protein n=1 Tax=Burkholderia pseudomallei TaxID=28450 RepID=UPI000F4EEDC7|nr:hypothetical protein [Burkholderia pseudomallei]
MTKSNDQPIQSSHGLDEAMKTIQGVEQALAERGLTCHSGSALGSLFAKVRRLADDTKRPLSDEKKRRTFLKANEALHRDHVAKHGQHLF